MSVWRSATRWFALGLVTGGALVGSGFGLVSNVAGLLVSLVPINATPFRMAAVFFLVSTLAVVELTGRGSRLIQNRRQVPQFVNYRYRRSGAFLFGFEMGTGMRTYLPSAFPLALVAGILILTPGVIAGALAGVGFGCGRTLMVLARNRADDRDRWDQSFKALGKPILISLFPVFAASLLAGAALT